MKLDKRGEHMDEIWSVVITKIAERPKQQK